MIPFVWDIDVRWRPFRLVYVLYKGYFCFEENMNELDRKVLNKRFKNTPTKSETKRLRRKRYRHRLYDRFITPEINDYIIDYIKNSMIDNKIKKRIDVEIADILKINRYAIQEAIHRYIKNNM